MWTFGPLLLCAVIAAGEIAKLGNASGNISRDGFVPALADGDSQERADRRRRRRRRDDYGGYGDLPDYGGYGAPPAPAPPPPSPAAELSQRSTTFTTRHTATTLQEAQDTSNRLFGSSATSRGRNSVFVAPNSEALFEAIRLQALQDIGQEQGVNYRLRDQQDIRINAGIAGSTLYTFYPNGRWDTSVSAVTMTIAFHQPVGDPLVIDSIEHVSAASSSSSSKAKPSLRGQGADRAFRSRHWTPPEDGRFVIGETQKSHDCSFDPNCCCVWLYEYPNFEGRSIAVSPNKGIPNLREHVRYFDVGSIKFVGRENLCKLEVYNWPDFKLMIAGSSVGPTDPDDLPTQFNNNIMSTGAYWEYVKTTAKPWDSFPMNQTGRWGLAESVRVLWNTVPPQRNVGYWERRASLRDEISYSNTTSITNSHAESLEHGHTKEVVTSIEGGLFFDGAGGSVSSSSTLAESVAETIEKMYAKETSVTVSHQCSKKLSPPPARLPLQGALWEYRVRTKKCSDVGTNIFECTWMLGGLAKPKCEPFECYNNECTLCGQDGHPPP
ncbi:unnamed protein product [Effrenium voratum]|nr:unnamed protein product [Effrenium voratum]CAJ1462161.1 unnamed protein product [Effrenium voratum]